MSAAAEKQWPQARYLLEHGAPVNHGAKDNATLASVLQDLSLGTNATGKDDADYQAMLMALLSMQTR